jgi:hypothetical protein
MTIEVRRWHLITFIIIPTPPVDLCVVKLGDDHRTNTDRKRHMFGSRDWEGGLMMFSVRNEDTCTLTYK